jgi:hypothetical protein
MTKFSGNIMACCENGGGECTAIGTPVHLPNWSDQKCEERDSTLVPDWEVDWVSYSIEECCDECEFLQIKTFISLSSLEALHNNTFHPSERLQT